MIVVRTDHNGLANIRQYTTDYTDIRQVVLEYGRTNDTLKLYTDDWELISAATWLAGNRAYQFTHGQGPAPRGWDRLVR